MAIELFNKLSAAELERLAFLSEECGEVIQAVGKIIRHGYNSTWNNLSNRDKLEVELGDLMYAFQLMSDAKDINKEFVANYLKDRVNPTVNYFHHQDKME